MADNRNNNKKPPPPIAQVVEENDERSTNPQALSALARSEIEAQIATARRYPRDLKRFQATAVAIGTMNDDVADACHYSLPRKDKDGKEVQIVGPSVRLAEILAASYGNIHSGARIVDEGADFITAQGACWDLETNNKVQIESQRRITTKSGRRYGADMIMTTGNAAIAIAYRNAVFKVIPRAYIDIIFDTVKTSAVGDETTLVKRRQEVIARLGKIGVHPDRVFARLNKKTIEEVDRDDVALMIGLGTSIKDGVVTIDEAFPLPVSDLPVPPEGNEGRVAVVNPGNAPPPVASTQPVQVAQVARTSAGAPVTTETSPGASAAPQNASAQVDDPGDIPEEVVPPAQPQTDPEDQLILDKLDAAQTVADLSSVGSLIRTMKARIGTGRYTVLFNAYTKASNRIKSAPAK